MTYGLEWQDMSDYVVHFTKDSESATAYDNMLGILRDTRLEARSTFGIARNLAPRDSQKCVCFSEIPLHLLSRLADRRGDYGIGFSKSLVASRGAAPVWYPPLGTPGASAMWQLLAATGEADPEVAEAVWTITPFVDVPGRYPNGARYEFEWEREWRVRGDFPFSTADAALLIIPESLHCAARMFFADALLENSGPCYECPFIDPRWDAAQIDTVLGVSNRGSSA